ncbi:hypothetical protein [Sulfurovum sp.]|uniref:hypothetical protein n=1 Tax=Sulfurovum sp. TaxID=1969726 RepID=UPI0035649227
MKHNYKILILTLFMWATALNALTNSTSDLPKVFQESIPTKLNDNLQLVEVENRCDGCNTWRYIDFYSNESREPIKREKVSVQNGYRAMYAYPNSHYFSNTKIEQSISGEYQHDKKIVVEAIKHEYNRKKERIYAYLNEHPELKAKMAPYKAKNKDYMELEENNCKGYEYISYTENVLGLTGNTISQVHIFVPEKQIIVTAYLLNQKKAHFKTIDEFLKLRQDFIESYIDFLAEHKGSKQ